MTLALSMSYGVFCVSDDVIVTTWLCPHRAPPSWTSDADISRSWIWCPLLHRPTCWTTWMPPR